MRDFGDILDEFEGVKKLKNNKKDFHKNFRQYIDKHKVIDKDAILYEKKEIHNINYKALKFDAVCDLHCYTKDKAIERLNDFFTEALEKHYKKVLIIHGKGKHSKESGVLEKVVKDFLEKFPNAGKRDYAKNSEGGRGATWVIIKNN